MVRLSSLPAKPKSSPDKVFRYTQVFIDDTWAKTNMMRLRGLAAATNGSGTITIEIAGAIVRAEPGVDPGWLRDVLRAVKAAT